MSNLPPGLAFEQPILDMDQRIAELEAIASPPAETADQLRQLRRERTELIRSIYSQLDPWQVVQVAVVVEWSILAPTNVVVPAWHLSHDAVVGMCPVGWPLELTPWQVAQVPTATLSWLNLPPLNVVVLVWQVEQSAPPVATWPFAIVMTAAY